MRFRNNRVLERVWIKSESRRFFGVSMSELGSKYEIVKSNVPKRLEVGDVEKALRLQSSVFMYSLVLEVSFREIDDAFRLLREISIVCEHNLGHKLGAMDASFDFLGSYLKYKLTSAKSVRDMPHPWFINLYLRMFDSMKRDVGAVLDVSDFIRALADVMKELDPNLNRRYYPYLYDIKHILSRHEILNRDLDVLAYRLELR